ncbi:uncharacterized protein PgNI_07971 [Pyricularia grisea]|uniref:Uncharacterized protein n=1 Tax=Pyricularia grisea TaxID=148305 RepID=A0A6P8B3E3_PYRGI|nr:uncharacterized protein PgNI_07971 [Pyricularia grisea]TLD09213.1 hypothetical protein PgNI_07971 [Pyricularia grisea]
MSVPNFITAHEFEGGPPEGLSLPRRLRWSKTNPPKDPAVTFRGRTVLVTGANSGLGFEAAVKYATLGADKIILAVRSIEKGEKAKERIIERTGRDATVFSVLKLDLGEYSSVKAFVSALQKVTIKLDVALLNAGLGNPTYEKSSAEWEMAVQVNVLSTALLAMLLLPLLQSSASASEAKSHLTFVNSHAHNMVSRDFPLIEESILKTANHESSWNASKSYSLVKLLAMAVMQAFARMESEKEPQRVIVNSVCPDLCDTDLGRKWTGFISKIGKIIFYYLFARSAEEGARSLVSATALGTESHGRFWHHDFLYPFGELAQDHGLMKTTWDEIVEAISQDQPEMLKLCATG